MRTTVLDNRSGGRRRTGGTPLKGCPGPSSSGVSVNVVGQHCLFQSQPKTAAGASQGAFNAAVFALLKDGFVENERRGRYVFYRPKTDENDEDGRRTE